MNRDPKGCHPVQLKVLLDGDEHSDEFRQAADHLETCPDCQRRLTELSGPEQFWQAQREWLQPLEGDDPLEGHWNRFQSSGVASASFSASAAGWDPRVDEASVRELLESPSHPEMLGRLGRYEIEEIVGSGGMGIVLKGFDSQLNRPVAIKLLSPQLARVGAARQRFAREARAAAAVVHEHVVAIHNVESEHSPPFLVMPYIPGESLQARVDREGPLSVAEILRIGLQAASGLAAAHAQGLVHRDVKPANILLEYGVDRAYLTDFGLARASDDASLTQTGLVAGTPNYMSPEQADGEALDHRSDLFSLGSVLYFMATGHPPFRADRPLAVLKRICHDRHRPAWQLNAELPAKLSDVIDRLLQKKPAARPTSAEELRDTLARLLTDVQRGRTRRRWMRAPLVLSLQGLVGTQSRLRWAAAAAALLATAAVIWALGSAGDWWWPSRATGQPTTATQSNGGEPNPRSATAPSSAAAPDVHAVDPSPAPTAARDLMELSRRLDQLQSLPFPETGTLNHLSPTEER